MAVAQVLIIYTGGTIGSVHKTPGDLASPLVPGTLNEIRRNLRRAIPGLGKASGVAWRLALPDKHFTPVDSSNVGPDQWRAIAESIERHYDKFDGFVILHGTDTLAYSASALSFALKGLTKPVVLTGSQLPLFDERSDAPVNIANSVSIAGGWKNESLEIPQLPLVMVCFGTLLLQGNRTRKMSALELTGFESPNYPHLATLGERIAFSDEARNLPMPREDEFGVDSTFEQGVVDIVVFPGIQETQLRSLLVDSKVRGAVVRTFGAGNIPTRRELLNVFHEATKAGVVILNVTQCPRGRVDMGLYETGMELLKAGAVSGLDLTPEAALTKMQWVLASFDDYQKARASMMQNLCGEQSGSIRELELHQVDTRRLDAWRFESRERVSLETPVSRAVLRLDGLHLHDGIDSAMLKVYFGVQAKDDTNLVGEDDHWAGDIEIIRKENPDDQVLLDFRSAERKYRRSEWMSFDIVQVVGRVAAPARAMVYLWEERPWRDRAL
jgi:L-asparaginase